jgi:ABC-2 type transport system ATP-binding protein
MHVSALAALKRAPGLAGAHAINGGRGLMSATLEGDASGKAGNAAVRALLEVGIPILSFEVEGGKLSDAFLALTGEAGE